MFHKLIPVLTISLYSVSIVQCWKLVQYLCRHVTTFCRWERGPPRGCGSVALTCCSRWNRGQVSWVGVVVVRQWSVWVSISGDRVCAVGEAARSITWLLCVLYIGIHTYKVTVLAKVAWCNMHEAVLILAHSLFIERHCQGALTLRWTVMKWRCVSSSTQVPWTSL